MPASFPVDGFRLVYDRYWADAQVRSVIGLIEEILDGQPSAVRAYLRHFWSQWSGPSFELPDAALDRLVGLYAAPGAFTASIAWYRAGSGTIARSVAEISAPLPDPVAVPTTILWPEFDPLFPPEWGDRVSDFFSDATVKPLAGVGHFVPLEAPVELAGAIRAALASPLR